MGDARTIQEKVRAAGVVGAGGAGFPTHVKFASKAEIFLVNGAECEPLLKVDQQLAEKYADLLIRGLHLGMQATGAREGVIALKAKYGPAVAALTPRLQGNMRIHILRDVYPAGDEVITIWMATGRRVPPAALPLDVGVIVNNVQTLINVARAVDEDMPVTLRTLTVTGAVRRPVTVTVPIGTAFGELLELAGGATIPDPVYIAGGPMMGSLLGDLSEPVTKGSGGIIALPKTHILIRRRTQPQQVQLRIARAVCEQCRLCTELCPRHMIGHELPPHLIVRSINYNNIGNPSVLLSALTCSECAVCEAWACPVDISPKRLNQALKAEFRSQGARYTGSLRDADPMTPHRLVPISRLISRLNIGAYNRKAPLEENEYRPQRAALKLRQHIGAPAVPVVQAGEIVESGQLVADIPEGALGARVHASIAGRVEAIDANAIHLSAI
ncbi:MAG: SLBB domain-containing protein [Desulfovibrio sp.]|jgi:Na+-translocating ferredoxin:NAD+ oxidoreductase RnfC subunit|nr:SLBB domain-containing protein [Desulfovibrio sp.]